MEEELLKELDSILQPAIQQSWSNARRMSFGSDPREAFLDLLKVQLDNTKVDISKSLHQIDLAMQGNSENVDFDLQEILQSEETINVDMSNYVRDTENGTEVFDGTQWFLFSKESQIDFQVNTSPETDNAPLVKVSAYDPTTNFRVAYIDYDTTVEGNEFSYSGNADDFSMNAMEKSIFYQDPLYSGAKFASGSMGLVAGELEAFTMAQHYVNYDEILSNPFKGGRNYGNGAGRFKMLDGKWANFDEIRNAKGFKQNGLKVSANSSRIRGNRAAFGFKMAGRVLFGVSVIFSGYESYSAYSTNDSNQKEVYLKSGLDVTMGLVAFIPVVGWAISGTYFIADAFGAFGDFGKPSGISQEEYNEKLLQEIKVMHGDRVKSLKFEVDYLPPIENEVIDLYSEERQVKVDNTFVAPSINIQKIKF